MPKYKVTTKETLFSVDHIDAEDLDDAYEKANEMHEDGYIFTEERLTLTFDVEEVSEE